MVSSTWPSHVDSSRIVPCLMDSSVPTGPLISMRLTIPYRSYSAPTQSNLGKIKAVLTTTSSTRLQLVLTVIRVCYTSISWTRLSDHCIPTPLVLFVVLWTLIWTFFMAHFRTQTVRRYSRSGSELGDNSSSLIGGEYHGSICVSPFKEFGLFSCYFT